LSERKLLNFMSKSVIPNEVRNLIFTKLLDLKISPFGRNDKNMSFRSDSN